MRIPIFFPVILLIILSCPLFAAAEQTSQSHGIATQRIWAANGLPTSALLDITSEYSKGIHMDFKSETTATPPREILPDPSPLDFSKKYSGKLPAFTFYNSKETKWSFEPLSDKFSLNPLADIRNVEVFLQYKL